MLARPMPGRVQKSEMLNSSTIYRKVRVVWLFAFGLLLSSCGGGGGSSPIDLRTLTNVRLEVFHALAPTQLLDPRNLAVDVPVTFVIKGVTPTNQTVTVPVTWSTTADPAVATISSAGVFLGRQVSGTSFDVSATFGEDSRSVNVNVVASAAHIGGRFVSGSAGVPSARLRIFGPSGEVLGTAQSDETGRFVLSVPTNARRVSTLFSGSTSYSTTYGLGGLYYLGIREGSPDDGSCRVPLPTTLSNNRRTELGNISLFSAAGVPPPPPDGCVLNP